MNGITYASSSILVDGEIAKRILKRSEITIIAKKNLLLKKTLILMLFKFLNNKKHLKFPKQRNKIKIQILKYELYLKNTCTW